VEEIFPCQPTKAAVSFGCHCSCRTGITNDKILETYKKKKGKEIDI